METVRVYIERAAKYARFATEKVVFSSIGELDKRTKQSAFKAAWGLLPSTAQSCTVNISLVQGEGMVSRYGDDGLLVWEKGVVFSVVGSEINSSTEMTEDEQKVKTESETPHNTGLAARWAEIDRIKESTIIEDDKRGWRD